ncbi:hypothetical protein HPB50_013062 [Hyalomma asiaticum]|uniref:Uncharacterized protein n=1 Tax=Hyalomma asiaticum TaxID=266040 RepID=A0ACB7SMI4_HYAAI|nr:hypothetical protein HPB50_013062 [Hyalomma asiaticum]
MHLGRLGELRDTHLISGLIDGFLANMEMALAGLTLATWIPLCSDLKHSAYQVDKSRSTQPVVTPTSVCLMRRYEHVRTNAGTLKWMACLVMYARTMNAHDAQALLPSLKETRRATQSSFDLIESSRIGGPRRWVPKLRSAEFENWVKRRLRWVKRTERHK